MHVKTHTLALSLHTLNPPSTHTTEAFQHEEVRPALRLRPKAPLGAEEWNRFLDMNPEVRSRIERHTPWRKRKVGDELAHIYVSLSGRVHGYQRGTDAVTISEKMLTAEECMLAAALLQGFVEWELDPPELAEQYERREGGEGRM